MKISLVRHFKVKKGLPNKTFTTPDELIDWFQEYDLFDIEDEDTELSDIEWTICFSNDLIRAVKIARFDSWIDKL